MSVLEDEIDGVLRAPYWSLAETLAWIAMRHGHAVARVGKAGNPDVALSILLAQTKATLRPVASSLDEAWKLLAPIMTEGLTAFATQVQKQQLGGLESSTPGLVFPPVDAPGLPLSCSLTVQNRQVALVPTKRVFLASWSEWVDFRFNRERVMEIFRPVEEQAVNDTSSTADTSLELSAPHKRNRQPERQGTVKPVLNDLYPNGIPPRSEMTNADLYRAVAAAMEEQSLRVPSPETVMRAAGRKLN